MLFNLSCATKAQVFDLNNDANYGMVTNGYYKDIENFQNQFAGTWIYQNGPELLEMRFVKKEMMLQRPGPKEFYEDVLVGEYRYIGADGIEKVNSLINLTADHTSVFDYNLHSGVKISLASYPKCEECPPGTERLYIFFSEQGNDDFGFHAAFVMRRVVENGVEKIKAQFVHIDSPSGMNKYDLDTRSIFRHFSLPYGNYILIKQ